MTQLPDGAESAVTMGSAARNGAMSAVSGDPANHRSGAAGAGPRAEPAAGHGAGPDLGRLYEALRGPLGRYVQRMVKDPSQAEDIVHDIFLQLHAKADQLTRVDNIEAWMYRVARNAVIDHVRKQQSGWGARADSAGTDDELANLAAAIGDDDGDSPHSPDSPHAREPRAALRLASSVRCFIDELPEHYRDALRLTEYEGLDRRSLADRQSISLTAAKSRVQRAKRMLMESLQRCCHLEFDRYGTLLDFSPRGQCCPCDGQPETTDVREATASTVSTSSTSSTASTTAAASCSGGANANANTNTTQNMCKKEDCR